MRSRRFTSFTFRGPAPKGHVPCYSVPLFPGPLTDDEVEMIRRLRKKGVKIRLKGDE